MSPLCENTPRIGKGLALAPERTESTERSSILKRKDQSMSERQNVASCLHCKKQVRDGQLHVVVFSNALQQRLRTMLAHYFVCGTCVGGLPGELPSSDEVYIFRAVSPVDDGVHLAHEVVHGERVFSLTFDDAVRYIGNDDLRRELTRSDRLRKVEN